MNLFIFKDINLTEGIFCQGNKVSNKLLSDIPNSTDTLFVLPNELLQHVYFLYFLNCVQNIRVVKAHLVKQKECLLNLVCQIL